MLSPERFCPVKRYAVLAMCSARFRRASLSAICSRISPGAGSVLYLCVLIVFKTASIIKSAGKSPNASPHTATAAFASDSLPNAPAKANSLSITTA